mgnify:FL=1
MTDRGFNYLDTEEYLNHNPFMKYNHMEIVTISPECSEIRLRVNPDALNLGGQVHGGLLYALADVVTGITARADGRRYVTQSAHINFIRNVSEGVVTAKGEMIRRGKTISILRSVVTDEKGTLLAEATVDMFCTGE